MCYPSVDEKGRATRCHQFLLYVAVLSRMSRVDEVQGQAQSWPVLVVLVGSRADAGNKLLVDHSLHEP